MKRLTKAIIKSKAALLKKHLRNAEKIALSLLDNGTDIYAAVKPSPEAVAAQKFIDAVVKMRGGK